MSLQCPHCTCPLDADGRSTSTYFCPGCNAYCYVKWRRVPTGVIDHRYGFELCEWVPEYKDLDYAKDFIDKPAPYCLLPWNSVRESKIVPDAGFHQLYEEMKKQIHEVSD